MVICGTYKVEFSVSKEMEKNNNERRRILAYLLVYLLTLIVKN